MIKLLTGVYVFITSIINASLVIWLSTEQQSGRLPFSIASAIVIFAAFLIGFFRDKIGEIETDKKLKEKDGEISELKRKLKDKEQIIHSIKGSFINNAINATDPEEGAAISRKMATVLAGDPVINNISDAPNGDMDGYLAVLTQTMKR